MTQISADLLKFIPLTFRFGEMAMPPPFVGWYTLRLNFDGGAGLDFPKSVELRRHETKRRKAEPCRYHELWQGNDGEDG